MRTFARGAAAALAGLAVVAAGCSPTKVPKGKPAPVTHGKDADGVAFDLSDYRGKVVMLDFWGNW
jgi:hypothetical protein